MNKNKLDISSIYNILLFEYNHGGIKSDTVTEMRLTMRERKGLFALITSDVPRCHSTLCRATHAQACEAYHSRQVACRLDIVGLL